MTSFTFETKQFRVQITGKTVWVESREEAGWILRNQHILPVSPDVLRGRGDSSVLRAAVQQFESTRGGDKSLREALTQRRERKMPTAPKPAETSPVQFKRAVPSPKTRRQNMLSGWRTPLRPPLAV